MGTTKTPEKLNGNRKSKEAKRNTKTKKDEDNEKQDSQRVKKNGSSSKSIVNEKEEQNQATEQPKPRDESKKSNENTNDGGKKRKRNDKYEEEKESKLYAFPMHRLQTIMKSEGSDLNLNQEAYFLINKATEKFMEQFCEDVYDSVPTRDSRRSFKYKHLSSTVNEEKRYDFLTDFVPEKIKFEDALKEIIPAETLRE